MPLKIPKEEVDKLISVLEPQHQTIKALSRELKLSYSDAALLLIDFHINELHAIAEIYRNTLNPSPKP